MILLLVRIIGLLVSIDFYYSTKSSNFIIFIFAWLLWILAALFPIISEIAIDPLISDIFLLFNAIFASVSALFILFGLVFYIYEIPNKIKLIFTIIVILLPLITLIFDKKMAINLAIVFQNIVFVSAFIAPLVKLNTFKKQVGKSIRWYYGFLMNYFIYFPIPIIIFLQGYSYGLYDSTNDVLIILNYLPTIIATNIIIIFLIHIEYNNSTILKNKLKDQYSHDLGNILQILLGIGDLLKLKEAVDESELDNLTLLKKKSKEASKLINEIRKLK